MTRKVLLILLVVVLAFALTGCGGGDEKAPAATANNTANNTQGNAAPQATKKLDEFNYVLNSTAEWARIVRYNGDATAVTIPEKLGGKPVKEIGAYTFVTAQQVTELNIPASVTKIDDPSFSDLPNLAKITVAEDNIGFAAIDDVLFHKKMKTIYCYPQGKAGDSYTLPDTITTIAAKAFYHSQLKSVVMPDTVTKILASAFEGSKIEQINLSAKLSQIYESAFADCSGLTSIVFPEKLTSLAANSFKGCTGLTEITVPANVGVMDAGAFDGCTGLKKVDIQTTSLQRVSANTFRGCSALESVSYKTAILGIADEAFSGCAALKEFELTDAIATLGRSAFAGCSSLEGLYIPDTLTDIGAHALDGTKYLESLAGDYAITGGGVLLAVRGEGKEITVPAGVTCISFTRADAERVTVPEGVTVLNAGAFTDCTALKAIELPASLTSIGADAFKNCTSLESFTVPAGTTAIGSGCFQNCTAVKEYNVAEGNVTFTSDSGVLYDNSRKLLIWYPSASAMTSYSMPYGPVGITDHAIENVANLESFNAVEAQGVQSIDDYVFANCPKLKTVKFTENFSRFGAHAFEGDTALSDFKLTAVMTVFGEYAFAGCTALGDQSVSANLGKIGVGTFENTNGTYTVFDLTLGEEFVKTWNLSFVKK
ncbi:MAG: leucine-rich repeat domain-containing protein [Clostridia bacterium]|nr:leucine-rich repeat domain-containing protein [Clostridia bacterium]